MEKKKRQLIMQRINKHLSRCLWLNIAKYESRRDLQWHTIEITNPLKGVVASYSPLLTRRLLRKITVGGHCFCSPHAG